MDGLHWPDLMVLLVVGVLVFGPRRLPEMGAAVGKALRAFRAAMRDGDEPAAPRSTSRAAAEAVPTAPAETVHRGNRPLDNAPAESGSAPIRPAVDAPAQE